MRGAYILIVEVPQETEIDVGGLGRQCFDKGSYVYVGSALAGVEQRVARHKSKKKRMRWHIDYLLSKAKILATVAIPGGRKEIECRVAETLRRCEGARVPVKGFGSSDCRCESHLIYFGDVDPEAISETVMMRVSMLDCVYPRRTRGNPRATTPRQ